MVLIMAITGHILPFAGSETATALEFARAVVSVCNIVCTESVCAESCKAKKSVKHSITTLFGIR